MGRKKLVRLVVLNAICDDYENLDQTILPTVVRDAAECGVERVDRAEVVTALTSLVVDGLAEAFTLSPHESFSVCMEGVPSLEVVEEDFRTYFLITKKGMDLHLSDDEWPFKLDNSV